MKFFLALLMSFSISHSQKSYGNAKVSKVVSVHDGDTFTIIADSSWPPIIKNNITVRVDSIDCPEITSKVDSIKAKAVKAKEFTQSHLKSAKSVKLVNIKRDKYFRILATVQIDSWNLADSLILLNLAKPYSGKTKESW